MQFAIHLLPWLALWAALCVFIILRRNRRHRGKPTRCRLQIQIGQEVFTMSFSLKSGQSATISAAFTDAAGVAHPLAPGNVPAWSVSPDGAVSITPAADGLSAEVVGGATPGDFTVSVNGEGDPVVGADTITGNIAGTIVEAEDTQVTLTAVVH
jgi:preprotein translocase subunit YajC